MSPSSLIDEDDVDDVEEDMKELSLRMDELKIEIQLKDWTWSHRVVIAPSDTFNDLAEYVYEDEIPDGLRMIFNAKQVVLSQTIASAGFSFVVFFSSLLNL